MDKKFKFFFIFLVILLIINAVFSEYIHNNHIDSFVNFLPLKSLNYCGRKVSFPNQITSNVLASTRAKNGRLGNTDPLGVCNSIGTTGDVDASSSVVVENSLYYILEKACLGLRWINYSIDATGNVLMTFLHNSPSDRDNISFLLLLNPLYVEFITNTGINTQGYRLDCQTFDKSWNAKQSQYGGSTTLVYSPYYSNTDTDFDSTYASHIDTIDGKHVITLRFIPIIDPTKTNCDVPFDYNSANISQLTGNNLEILKKSKQVINLNVYYLNEIETSFQQPSRLIQLDYDLTGSQTGKSVIFWNDYDNDSSPLRANPLTLNEKKFMNNLRIMYSNYIAPSFTWIFDICVTADIFSKMNPGTIAMCYADDGNEWMTCNSNNVTGGKNNNNIFSASIWFDSNSHFYLTITTSKNNPSDCNWNGADPDCLNIKLPYNSKNDSTKIILEISPNQKLLYAQWFLEGQKKFSLGKTVNCPDSTPPYDMCGDTDGAGPVSHVNNNYSTLFTNQNRAAGSILPNIVFSYYKPVVQSTSTVYLGYQNLYKIMNK